MIVKTNSPKETQKVARDIADKILKSRPSKPARRRGENAVVVALEGELGAGKTVFVKGFAKALGIKSHITSPTFVLLKQYKIPASPARFAGESARRAGRQTKNYKLLVHIDAYRLKDYRDLIPLGVKEIIADPQNIVLIEWSDRVKQILPAKFIKIHIDHVDLKIRKITISH